MIKQPDVMYEGGKNMKKRQVALALAAVMAVGSVAGCSGSSDTKTTTTAAAETTAAGSETVPTTFLSQLRSPLNCPVTFRTFFPAVTWTFPTGSAVYYPKGVAPTLTANANNIINVIAVHAARCIKFLYLVFIFFLSFQFTETAVR